jgi:hypothetical protein
MMILKAEICTTRSMTLLCDPSLAWLSLIQAMLIIYMGSR